MLFRSRERERERRSLESTEMQVEGRGNWSSWCLLMLLADALLPGMLALLLPVAVGRVEDPPGQGDGLGDQLLLGDAALPQVRLRGHARGLGPAVRDVVGAVERCVGVGGTMGVGVQPHRLGVGMRVGVGVRVGV